MTFQAPPTTPTTTTLPSAVTTPTSLYAHIKAAIASGLEDQQDIAEAAIAALTESERRRWLLQLVRYEVSRIQRAEVRRTEIRVRTDIAAGADPTTARRLLMEQSFILPDGRWVEWLKATADDHLARAGWLLTQENSIRDTRLAHEEAAQTIIAAGVTCLADLDN
jgi:hypothetical protein